MGEFDITRGLRSERERERERERESVCVCVCMCVGPRLRSGCERADEADGAVAMLGFELTQIICVWSTRNCLI